MSGSTILVYTDCPHLNSGDFTAAAKLTYSISLNLHYGLSVTMISSDGGVGKLKSLYPSRVDGKLNIAGEEVGVMSTKEARRIGQDNIAHFVEVGFCKPCPLDDFAFLTKALRKPVTYVHLACYSASSFFDERQRECNYLPVSSDNPYQAVWYGFGPERSMGQFVLPSTAAVPIADLKKPYGSYTFTYFRFDLNLPRWMHVQEKLHGLSHLQMALVGESDCLESTLASLTRDTRSCFITINGLTGDKKYHSAGQSRYRMPDSFDMSHVHRIWHYDKLANSTLKAMLAASEGLTLLSGVESVLEGLAGRKAIIDEVMSNNVEFETDYIKAFKEMAQSLPYSKDYVESLCQAQRYLYNGSGALPESFDRSMLSSIGQINGYLTEAAATRFHEQSREIVRRSLAGDVSAPAVAKAEAVLPFSEEGSRIEVCVPKAPDTA